MAINLDHVTEQITVTDTATNASLTVQPKGTGAFNIAAGSSGVNLSNGNTVTAVTVTALGSYTSTPTAVISAPTAAGGVQATFSFSMQLATPTIVSGGTGYTVGNILSLVGGTLGSGGYTATVTVSAVSSGVITGITISNFGGYEVVPTGTISLTGGSGSGATITSTWYVRSAFPAPSITNAGSGYVEQPTVTFSGGGGSGAAAYATVGGTTTIKGIGYGVNNSTIKFVGPSGVNQLELWDVPASDSWMAIQNTQYARAQIVAQGNANAQLWFSANGSGIHNFSTSGTSLVTQARISHTASAVNYVNITGAATGSGPTISAQGSDTNIGLIFNTKGSGISAFTGNSGTHFAVRTDIASATNYWQVFGDSGSTPRLRTNGGNATLESGAALPFVFATNANSSAATQFIVNHTASAVNYIQVTGNATNGAPTISALGSDANVYLDLKSKGNLQISLYTGGGIQFAALHTASAVNYPTAKGSATGFGVILGATGSDTNIPLVLQPKGTGALQANQTDSTATGGNARGSRAVDLQMGRDSASQVADGAGSVIGGGYANRSGGNFNVVAGGNNNTATYSFGVIGGGVGNSLTANSAVIAGGASNVITFSPGNNWSFIGAGQVNTAHGVYNLTVGGYGNSGTSGTSVTTQSATMNGTTAVTLSGSNASIKVGQYIIGTSIAADTYVAAISGTSLTLSKVASGSSTSTLSFYTPHGVVVGGGNNQATGSYSFIGGGGDAGTAANRNVASGDWSVVGGGFKNVGSGVLSAVLSGTNNTASGISSVVCGGGTFGSITQIAGNTASGLSSFVGAGFGNTASSNASFVGAGKSNVSNALYSFIGGGTDGTTRGIWGSHVIPALNPLNGVGTSQSATLVLGKQTTDATATVLTVDGSAPSTANQVILPNNSAYYFRGEIISGVTGGGNTKGFFIEGVIKRGANAASTALVGTPTVTSTYADAGASTWTIAVTADTTNGGLAVTFTGQASTTIRTVAQIRTTEMTY